MKQKFEINDKVVVINDFFGYIGGLIAFPTPEYLLSLFKTIYYVRDTNENFIGEIVDKSCLYDEEYYIIKNLKTNILYLITNKYNEIRHYYKSLEELKEKLSARKIWLNNVNMKFGSEAGTIGTISEIDFHNQYITYIDYEGDEIEETIDVFVNSLEV